MKTTRILVWDLPTRLFHWLLAGSILVAFGIATTTDDDGSVFGVHMLLGLTAAFLVVARVVWGVAGTRYARFGSFPFRPRALFAYLKGALTRRGERHVGHNPATVWAMVAMFALVLGLAASGLAMGAGGGEVAEEAHEIMAWALMAVVGAHVLGVAWHSLRFRENLAWSMVDGRKPGEETQAIRTARPVAGLLFLALTGAWTAALFQGYDTASGRLTVPLVGATLQLGEAEHDEAHEHESHDD